MAPRKMAHIYRQVPSDQDEATIGLEFEPRKRRGFSRFSRVAITMAVLALLLLVVLSSALSTYGSPSGSKSCDEIQQGYQCKPEISHFWGQYSPYYSVPSEIPAEIPEACKVTFVQVLSRHGARDPTASKTVIYAALIAKLHSNVQSFKGKYAFLKDYKYSLGADQLTTFGQQQLINSGIKFYERYRPLARSLPIFVRSSGQARVVESAQNFTQGYHNTRLQDKGSSDIDGYPYPILEISEDDGMNNTLNHDLCNAFEDGPASKVGSDAQLKWQSIFAPVILGRLNKELPGASLTVAEVVLFMDLCPFESVSSRTGMVSPFCNLFTEQEWHQYDYFQSLGKYYGYGPGNPLGPTQGVGYVNELVARMTGKPVQDHTSVNHTLDDSHKTFPFGHGHHLFADFSHDNDMTAIFAALGLYNSTEPLSNTTLETTNETNGYAASWTAPFASRAYIEKMNCEGVSQELVRVLVNDRVIPLRTCRSDHYGRCKLSEFVQGLSFARAGGNWDQCFVS